MLKKGCKTENIMESIGTSISVKNYEVKIDVKRKFLNQSKENSKYFTNNNHKIYFNLSRFVFSQLLQHKIKNVDTIKIDTFDPNNKFFSARRALSLKNDAYGRNISIIMIN